MCNQEFKPERHRNHVQTVAGLLTNNQARHFKRNSGSADIFYFKLYSLVAG